MSTHSTSSFRTPFFAAAVALLVTALCAVALLVSATPKSEDSAPSKDPVVAVTSATVEYQQIAQKVYASGKLTHKGRQALGFKISGTISQLNVEEGQPVKKGDVLASLELEEINAELAKAKSVHTQSQRDLTRLTSLYKKKVIPINQLEDARTALEVAEANLDLAIEKKRQAVLIAPQDGIVLSRFVESSELVRPHQTAFVISDTSKGWVIRTQVSDKDIVRINKNDETRIKFDAYPGHLFQGAVSEVAAAADTSTLLFEVEIQVAPENYRLLEGFIGHMEIVPAFTDRIAYVPVESVVAADKNRVKLFQIHEDQTVSLEEASMAWLESGQIAIREGLEEGAVIVNKGATFLHEGAKIQLADAQQ